MVNESGHGAQVNVLTLLHATLLFLLLADTTLFLFLAEPLLLALLEGLTDAEDNLQSCV